jgi:flagellar hook-associated protein 1
MGVSGALSASLSGLSVTRAQLDVLATNISNVDTPGYTRKTLSQSAVFGGSNAIGVRTETLDRQLDALLQKQIRSELGASGYTQTLSAYHDRLNAMMGAPGSASAFDTLISGYTTSLSNLADNPASYTAQQGLLSDAQVLTQTLNAMSGDIQQMRSEAEQGIGDSVRSINEALQRIEQVNTSILAVAGNAAVPADLLDERDRSIDMLAREIDIQVLARDDGSVSIFTNAGVSLFDGQAVQLQFDQAQGLNALSVYSPVASERSVGTVSLSTGAGNSLDLLAGNTIRSGRLAAFVEMRDGALVQAQNQLDEFAHQLALSTSLRPQASTALDPLVPGFDGLQIDLAGIQPGNQVALDVRNTVAGTTQRVTLVHVTDPSSLPLSATLTARADDLVIGVDLSDPVAVAAAFVANGLALSASAGTGGGLQIVDDGAAGQADVTGLEARISVTGSQNGIPQFAMFSDGIESSGFYTASQDGQNQKTGFAARIQVSNSVADDPSVLSRMSANTPSGDATRANFLLEQFTSASFQVDPGTGIGSRNNPLTSTLAGFGREIVNKTGFDAASARRADEGQQIVTNGLLARQSAESGVNIDAEMARLTELQSIYAANAQVMSVAREMMDMLLAI